MYDSQEGAAFHPKNYLDDDHCVELMTSLTDKCCHLTEKFWLTNDFASIFNKDTDNVITESVTEKMEKVNVDATDSDDDDDDLEACESNEAPSAVKIHYVRDYLDQIGDLKTYDEVESALSAMPAILQHQLRLEHVQVAKDVLDAMFRWENQFDAGVLDGLRHQNLCAIVKTSAEAERHEIPVHFCQYFDLQEIVFKDKWTI